MKLCLIYNNETQCFPYPYCRNIKQLENSLRKKDLKAIKKNKCRGGIALTEWYKRVNKKSTKIARLNNNIMKPT
jgi:hypothetical protein